MYTHPAPQPETNPKEMLRLVEWLESDARRTRTSMRWSAAISTLTFGGLAAVAWKLHVPLAAIGLASAAVLLLVVAHLGGRRTSVKRTACVLDALQNRPGRIRAIRHSVVRRGLSLWSLLFDRPRHFVEISTDDGVLFVESRTWRALVSALERRCPYASVELAAW